VGQFRARLRIDLPEGWVAAKESVQVLAPAQQANVIVSSEDTGPLTTTEEYVAAHEHALRTQIEGYREISFAPAPVFGGRPGYLRHFEWQPPDGVPVTQLQAYLLDDGRGYTATATVPTSRFADLETSLRAVLDGIGIGD
jgi:hypothetical protein